MEVVGQLSESWPLVVVPCIAVFRALCASCRNTTSYLIRVVIMGENQLCCLDPFWKCLSELTSTSI